MSDYLFVAGAIILLLSSIRSLIKPSQKNMFGKDPTPADVKISKSLSISTIVIIVLAGLYIWLS